MTPDQVRAFTRHLCDHFGAEVRDKEDSSRMKAVAWFLDAMGIMDHDTFMKNYSTTIHTTVFTNFTVGEGDRDLFSQVTCLTHEIQHVHQARQKGFIVYAADYLGSRSSRANYEAEAFRCNVELEFWRWGRLLDLRRYAEKLRAYDCGDAEVDHVERYLRASADTITAGGVISAASQVAIAWLEDNAPEVQARNFHG